MDKQLSHKLIGYCPICKGKLRTEDALVFQRKKGVVLMHVDCFKCSSSILLMIAPAGLAPRFFTSVGMLTDMTKEDVKRLERLSALTIDDVLEIHKFLEQEK